MIIDILNDEKDGVIIRDWIYEWVKIDYTSIINTSMNCSDLPKIIVMKENDKLIGFYIIQYHDNDFTCYSPWISFIYIDKNYRGCGFGRKLIESIDYYCKKFKIEKCYLHSRINNFYEKFGFEKLEELHLNDGIKRNIYTKSIR